MASKKSQRHVMIDLETTSTKTNAAILTMAAFVFDPFSNTLPKESDGFYCRIDLDSCMNIGMDIDEGTMQWWSKQSEEAIADAFSEENRISISEAIVTFNKFAKNCTHFWANSPNFDMAILEYAAAKCNVGVCWQYYQLRDVRTINSLVTLEKPKTAHDALEDTLNQVFLIQKAFKELNIKSIT